MSEPINKITNLKDHLNSTINVHRFKGYTAWLDATDAGLNTMAKAKLFGVNWKTARKWESIEKLLK